MLTSDSAVEPLQSPRGPQSLDAIYLLTPTSQNVNRIIADFEGRRTYKSAHLYFIDGELAVSAINEPRAHLQVWTMPWRRD